MYQICVSGAAKGQSVELGKRMAQEAGMVIAKAGHVLMTGATTGLPHIAAAAYKQNGGSMSVGISPASTKVEHVMKYRLPTKPYDVILFTGMRYVGRDAFLINSSDAVISIGGRLGTLHEAMIAIETETPIGFMEGAGGTGDEIMTILQSAGREKQQDIIFDDDVKKLLDRLVKLLDFENRKYLDLFE